MDNGTEQHGTHLETTVADDAVPLCPACLEPCDPLDNYCPNCGSNEPINPLASYMPFVKIRYETGIFGKLWRKCWDSKISKPFRVLCMAMGFLFYDLFFLIGLPFLLTKKIKNERIRRLYTAFFYTVFILLVIAFFAHRITLAFQIQRMYGH
ncbi:MAG: hypothetical protein ACYSUT_09675 [Planctomycetota bacterium]|jgi:hypothetical protein